jgi:hypothetical protein
MKVEKLLEKLQYADKNMDVILVLKDGSTWDLLDEDVQIEDTSNPITYKIEQNVLIGWLK